MNNLRRYRQLIKTWTFCMLTACLAGAAQAVDEGSPPNNTVSAPDTSDAETVDFERHVAALLGRLGCNAGSCHGSFQGKGGFRLSLFGHSPERDYFALARGADGRRVNLLDPDQSLMLLKPTMQVPHEGGKRLKAGSLAYRVLHQWIAQGAPREVGRGEIVNIEVLPHRRRVERPGETVQLKVMVKFADGDRWNMTPFCGFRSKDDSIAEVNHAGLVKTLTPGDTAIVVSYRGQLATSQVLVPVNGTNNLPQAEPHPSNGIDQAVFAKLRELNIVAADLAGDTDFLRRVTIDAIGQLPAPDEIRAFLADNRPDKRQRKIDQLLAHPLHAALWATRLCDITGADLNSLETPQELRPKRAKMWHDWFRRRIAVNVPYDKIVGGILSATSRDGLPMEDWISQETSLIRSARKGFETDYASRPSLDLYWRRNSTLEQMTELTATALLGVRIECAQCHKHPFDRWTQSDYRSFASVLAPVRFDSSPQLRSVLSDLLQKRRQAAQKGVKSPPIPRMREVYLSPPRRGLRHPDTGEVLQPKALGGPVLRAGEDPRRELFRWLVRPDNPFFAKSFVNRVWSHYFGVGLVEPVDAFSVANPSSNRRLLDFLAQDFALSGYNIRRLERKILMSRTYQLSALPGAADYHDRRNFSRSFVRPLLAEVVLDVLNGALGVEEDFGADAPPGVRAVEVAPSRVGKAHASRVFRLFNRPARTTNCDCERPQQGAVRQTLYLMSDPAILAKISKGRLRSLLETDKSDSEIIDELFLATLSRFPDAAEKQTALEHVSGAHDRAKAYRDTVWALINTREFITNH